MRSAVVPEAMASRRVRRVPRSLERLERLWAVFDDGLTGALEGRYVICHVREELFSFDSARQTCWSASPAEAEWVQASGDGCPVAKHTASPHSLQTLSLRVLDVRVNL